MPNDASHAVVTQNKLLDALDQPGTTVSPDQPGAMVFLHRDDVRAALKLMREAYSEAEYWKAGCTYLADCHAANGEDCYNKSIGRTAKERLRNIATAALGILKGDPSFLNVRRSLARYDAVQERLSSLLAETAPVATTQAAPAPERTPARSPGR